MSLPETVQDTFISTMHSPLYTALLATLVKVGYSHVSDFDFTRRSDFDGLFCTTPTTVTMTTRTRLHCAETCADFADSPSFFYNSETRACSCQNGVVSANQTCQVSPSTVYYVPREPSVPATTPVSIGYHGDCTSDEECGVSNTGCWHGVCECTPGYSYYQVDGTCVDVCPSGLGNTFTTGYLGKDLSCTNIGSASGTVNMCLEECLESYSCLAVSFHTGISACQFRPCTPLSAPFTDSQVITTYIRNCSPP